MGANSPSTTQYAHKIIDSLKPLFELLPTQYRSVLKKYSEYILKHRIAIHYATELLPILAALVIIQVERDINHALELSEIRREVDELRREIKKLVSSE